MQNYVFGLEVERSKLLAMQTDLYASNKVPIQHNQSIAPQINNNNYNQLIKTIYLSSIKSNIHNNNKTAQDSGILHPKIIDY